MKKRLPILIALILFFFILIINLHYAYADDWPVQGHDPARTGYSLSNSPNTNNTLWTFDAGNEIYSQPIVADDKIFFRCMTNPDKGWGKLYALNSTTGKEIWNYSGRNGASMAVGNGKIFFLDGYRVIGLYTSNGSKFWEHQAQIVSSESIYYEKLIIADNKLFINRPPIMIYDLNTMKYEKSLGVSESEIELVHFAIDVEKEIIFVYYYVDAWPPYPGLYYFLEAIKISTGEMLWKQEIFHEIDYIINSNNRIFIYESPEMKVFYGNNGSICWKRMGLVWPTIANGNMYIGYKNKVEALNITNGETIWSSEIKDRVIITPPTITKDRKIFIGTFSGYDANNYQVYALNEETGELICSYNVDGDIEIQPVVAEGKLFVVTTEGKLYAFGDIIPDQNIDNGNDGNNEDFIIQNFHFTSIYVIIGISILLILAFRLIFIIRKKILK